VHSNILAEIANKYRVFPNNVVKTPYAHKKRGIKGVYSKEKSLKKQYFKKSLNFF